MNVFSEFFFFALSKFHQCEPEHSEQLARKREHIVPYRKNVDEIYTTLQSV